MLLRDQPGAEAYLKRLEDKWYEVWIKHRGTPELPDDDPDSTWNFDLAAHITFLRAHIDKNALYVWILTKPRMDHPDSFYELGESVSLSQQKMYLSSR